MAPRPGSELDARVEPLLQVADSDRASEAQHEVRVPIAQEVQRESQPQMVFVDPRLARVGARTGGTYERENYCGIVSVLIGIFLLPCICCCPVDTREVYVEPRNGSLPRRRIDLSENC